MNHDWERGPASSDCIRYAIYMGIDRNWCRYSCSIWWNQGELFYIHRCNGHLVRINYFLLIIMQKSYTCAEKVTGCEFRLCRGRNDRCFFLVIISTSYWNGWAVRLVWEERWIFVHSSRSGVLFGCSVRVHGWCISVRLQSLVQFYDRYIELIN